ncbi:hypothetical protein [Plasticicumulans sp.]|uniref:hypothetical protein n=1 Tax=Plasticicumulans sp. TaxID=2307179 RepID=UPI00322012FF
MTSNNPIPAGMAGAIDTLHAVAQRFESGETSGAVLIELHPDGSADRWALGSVLSDRYRLAGIATALAHAALNAQEAQP